MARNPMSREGGGVPERHAAAAGSLGTACLWGRGGRFLGSRPTGAKPQHILEVPQRLFYHYSCYLHASENWENELFAENPLLAIFLNNEHLAKKLDMDK